MNLLKYFFSRYFLKQAFVASLFFGTIIAIVFIYLNISTNHNNYIKVPDLKGLSIENVAEILNKNKLKFEISDSTFFNPDFPKFVVLEQIPIASSEVKKNRKIYLTINPANFGNVEIPEIIQITKRSAISSLLSSNLNIGEITLIDNIGKDMVLDVIYQGEKIFPGQKIPMSSELALILGNGKR